MVGVWFEVDSVVCEMVCGCSAQEHRTTRLTNYIKGHLELY